ncbi:MAG: hypothetical protein MUO22_07670 [Sedimentisphaerales bacterium]|nr:hypothetical protein [Sedimentisphaerales bacterium]
MKRQDLNYIISGLLLLSTALAGITGYIQSQLDLRKFVPHRYFAYITLALAAIHVYLHAPQMWHYLQRKLKPKNKPDDK